MRPVSGVSVGMAPHLSSDSEIVFDHLQGYNSHLHAYWRAFKKLYRGNAALIPIFAATASDFFVLVEKSFLGTMLQMLRSLADPAVDRRTKSRNASLRGLLFTVYGENYETVAPKLSGLAGLLQEQVHPIRTFVNRSVAHSDWNIVAGLDKLSAVPMAQVDSALATVEQFLDIFAEEFQITRRDYENSKMDREIDKMLQLLSKAVQSSSAGDEPPAA